MAAAVQVRSEHDAVLVQRPPRGERHHLIAARVGQDRPRPGHEPVQPAKTRDPLGARTQHQVIGVGKDHLGARGAQHAGRGRLDRGLGADRHERGRLDGAVRGMQPAAPRRAVGREQLEAERGRAHGQARTSGRRSGRGAIGSACPGNPAHARLRSPAWPGEPAAGVGAVAALRGITGPAPRVRAGRHRHRNRTDSRRRSRAHRRSACAPARRTPRPA